MADALTLALMPRFVVHRWCSSMTKPAKRLWEKGAPSLKHPHVRVFPKDQLPSPLAILRGFVEGRSEERRVGKEC